MKYCRTLQRPFPLGSFFRKVRWYEPSDSWKGEQICPDTWPRDRSKVITLDFLFFPVLSFFCCPSFDAVSINEHLWGNKHSPVSCSRPLTPVFTQLLPPRNLSLVFVLPIIVCVTSYDSRTRTARANQRPLESAKCTGLRNGWMWRAWLSQPKATLNRN